MQVNAVDNPPQNPQGVEDAEEDEGGESMKIFEVDNSNEADSLLNILEIDPPDDGQVRVDGEYDEKIVEDTLVRNQIVTGIMAARFGSNLQPLPPGSARRVKDKDGNVHFFSSAHQPWTRDDIYLPSKHGFSVAETMDADVTETTDADPTDETVETESDATDTAAGEADLTGTTETAQ